MANEVLIEVKGRDAGGKAAMDAATQSGQKLGQSVDNIGKIVGGQFLGQLAQGAFTKLNGFMKDSIGLAVEQAKVEGQLAARIKSTGGAAGLSADEIKKMASGYQEVTNFGDEATISSSNVLLTFTQIGRETFPRAQKAVLDMSTALGQDLQSATIMVGKALNDPIKGVTTLQRAGVQLTEQQKEQIRTMMEAGDVAGAQAVILGELETQFGGSAEAAVEADGGITQLKNSMGDMQEEIGTRLIPIQARLVEMQLRLLDTFTSLPGPVQLIIGGVAVLSAGVLVLTPRLLAARAAMIQFGLSARAATLSLGAIGAVLAVLATAMVVFSRDTDQTVSRTDEFASSLDSATGKITEQTRAVAAAAVASSDFAGDLELLGISTSMVSDAIIGGRAEYDALSDALHRASGRSDEHHEAALNVLTGVTQLGAELNTARDRWDRTTEGVEGSTVAIDAHIDSLEELADELRAQIDPAFALIRAQQNLRKAQQEVTDAERKHTRNSPEYREALRKETEAGLDLLGAAGALGDEFTGGLSKAQRKLLEDAGISARAIRNLERDLRRAKRQADRLDGTRVDLNIHTFYSQSGRPPALPAGSPNLRPGIQQAHGGVTPIDSAQAGGPRGNMVLLGEHGPELVDLAPGSMVHTAGATRAMLTGDGGQAVRVMFDFANVRSDPFARFLEQMIRQMLQTNPAFRSDVRGER